VANPNPAPNPEVDKVVQAVVAEFKDGHGADAINQINTQYNNHRDDPSFSKEFTQNLTAQLEKQHLLPQVSAQLFGSADAMKLIDLNQDGGFTRSEAARIRSSSTLSGALTPLQQEVVAYMLLNADKIDRSGADDAKITPENLKAYADHVKDRELELKIANQILKDPQKFHDQFTSDKNGDISEYDLQHKISTVKDLKSLLDSDDDAGANAKTKQKLEGTQETAEYLLQHRAEIAASNLVSNDFSKQQLIDWATQMKRMDTEVLPHIDLVTPQPPKPGTIESGKPGYTSDLIKEYATAHFGDMALKGEGESEDGGRRITKDDIARYKELRKDTLTPFENKILDEMTARFDDIEDASDEHSRGITQWSKRPGISMHDLTAYAKQQSDKRAEDQGQLPGGSPSEQDLALKAASYFTDQAHFDQMGKQYKGYITPTDLRRQIEQTDTLMNDGEDLPPKTLAHLKERNQIAHFLQQQMDAHGEDAVTREQIYGWINKIGGDYIDAKGNNSSPEVVATAKASADAQQKPEQQIKPADQQQPDQQIKPVDQQKPDQQIKPADQQQPDQPKKLDGWQQYIKDRVTDKGGFTADTYRDALAQAESSGKEVVLVIGSRKHTDLLDATAKGVAKNDAVYVYVDKDTLDPNSPLGQYAKQIMPGDRTGVIGYHVTRAEDGHLQPGKAHAEVLDMHGPSKQSSASPDQQAGQPQQGSDNAAQPAQANPDSASRQLDPWNNYIQDNITAKGGYTADKYRDALTEASRTGKEVVVVFGTPNNPGMLEGAANGVLRQDAVYVYADANALDPNSSLGKLAQLSLQGRESGAIGFHVRVAQDGKFHREQYHPIVFSGLNHEQIYQYNTTPETYNQPQQQQQNAPYSYQQPSQSAR